MALPAFIANVVSEFQADGQAILDLIFPVFFAFLAAVIVTKLFKIFGNQV